MAKPDASVAKFFPPDGEACIQLFPDGHLGTRYYRAALDDMEEFEVSDYSGKWLICMPECIVTCGSENHVLCSDVENYGLDATGERQSLEPGGRMNTSP